MRQFTIIFLLSLISVQLNAQKSVLSGKAIDYISKELTFYTIPDPVLRQKVELANVKIGSDGTFSVAIPVSKTMEIYTDLEKYCGTMIVEPGKNYVVTLPPFSLRTTNEAHSIYFKPAPFWLGLPQTENSDVNFAVRSFVMEFNRETVQNTVALYQKKSKEVVTEIISRLDQKYPDPQNEYFRTLIKYYYFDLEYAVNQDSPSMIIQKYFATQPVCLNHPAYQRAFETLFTDFLRKQSQDIHSRKIISYTNSGNWAELVSFFENRGYSREFAELAVLKGLNDGFYSGSFSKDGVIRAVEMAQKTISTPFLLPLATQVRSKLTQLAVGGKAPPLRLTSQKNESVSLDQFKGKFVYLSFFNSKSKDCIAEIDSIVSIEKNLRQVLVVVSIAVDDQFDMALKLWKSKGYYWFLLDGSKQKQLIESYNATITPAFYLIDPEGKLRLSQAPSPSHGFEPLFLKMFRDYNFKRQRN